MMGLPEFPLGYREDLPAMVRVPLLAEVLVLTEIE